MGMKTSIVYGYGVDHDTLDKITTMQLVDFLQKHLPKDYENMMEDLANESDVPPTEADYDEWLADCSCVTSGISGKYSIIATAIAEETGIRVQYENSSDINAYGILLTECMPWQMNKKEKNCTQEDLDKIFKTYFSEFGLSVDPDFMEVEYFG